MERKTLSETRQKIQRCNKQRFEREKKSIQTPKHCTPYDLKTKEVTEFERQCYNLDKGAVKTALLSLLKTLENIPGFQKDKTFNEDQNVFDVAIFFYKELNRLREDIKVEFACFEVDYESFDVKFLMPYDSYEWNSFPIEWLWRIEDDKIRNQMMDVFSLFIKQVGIENLTSYFIERDVFDYEMMSIKDHIEDKEELSYYRKLLKNKVLYEEYISGMTSKLLSRNWSDNSCLEIHSNLSKYPHFIEIINLIKEILKSGLGLYRLEVQNDEGLDSNVSNAFYWSDDAIFEQLAHSYIDSYANEVGVNQFLATKIFKNNGEVLENPYHHGYDLFIKLRPLIFEMYEHTKLKPDYSEAIPVWLNYSVRGGV